MWATHLFPIWDRGVTAGMICVGDASSLGVNDSCTLVGHDLCCVEENRIVCLAWN